MSTQERMRRPCRPRWEASRRRHRRVPRSVTVLLTRLLESVPPEVIGFYLFAVSIVSERTDGWPLQWWLLGLLVRLGYRYGAVFRGVSCRFAARSQLFVSAVGFSVYAFAIGGWFATLSWYEA